MQLSTIIGVGCIVGAAALWWTGAPEIALLALGVTKVLLPEHCGCHVQPIDKALAAVEEIIEAS